MTCGAELAVKAVPIPNTDTSVELHLFDSAGQDIFAELMPSFWDGALAVVLVYDVTRQHTVDACSRCTPLFTPALPHPKRSPARSRVHPTARAPTAC